MSAAILTRVALVAAAAAAIVLLAGFQRSEDRCTDAVAALFVDARDRPGTPVIDARAGEVIGECHGSGRLVDSAAALLQVGDREAAERLAREAVRREPESFTAWAALAGVLRQADPAGAREAAERARELNPRWQPAS